MRRTLAVPALAGMVVGIVVVLTGPVATAGAPTVTKPACEASGGTFSVDRGTRTCTVVTTSAPVLGPVVEKSSLGPIAEEKPVTWYVGESQRTTTVVTTTTLSQKGNGAVTTQSTEDVVETVARLSCVRMSTVKTEPPGPTPVDLSVCADLGLFTA
jgi:hypothetical protein